MAKIPVPSLHLLPVFTTLFIYLLFPPCMPLTFETEALLEFKRQLKDPLSFLDSWKESESSSPCEFSGITCDSGKVTEISLHNKSLSGEISPSIGTLESLTTLVLSANLITGEVPAQLTHCANLKTLNLSENQLVGKIPDLSTLRNLERLDLSANRLSSEFPSWVGNLTGLQYLGLGQNLFDESEVPRSLGNLKNLTWLYLTNCSLMGEIPESIYEMKALGTFDMSRNKLSGKLSKSISKLQNLFKIELFANGLGGEIPPEVANLTLLREFDISTNKFYGKLPSEFGNLKNLVVFQLYENNFSGEFPAGFGDMQHLTALSIYGNRFSGEFPANLGKFSLLDSIDISENQFSGAFPRFLCEKRKLQFLLALDNNFYGEFPDSYADCKSLERFRVSKNHLYGEIPAEFWSLPKATIIEFSDNNFRGVISPSIGFSTSLNQLMLQNNNFSGYLPPEIGKLTKLDKLYLNHNNFSGEIPSEIGALKHLSSFHVEENSLSGSIPSELGNCVRLADMSLAGNSLTGSIPPTLSLMSSLNSLNLSRNKLSGEVPENLEKLKLSFIDLSENLLSGRVPSDLLTTGGDKAFRGNNELCIDQYSKTHSNSGMNTCSEKHSQKRVLQNKLVLFSIIASALVVVFAGLVLVSYKNFKLSEVDRENSLEEGKEIDPKWKLASFHQLEIDEDEICDLEEENLVGSGSTGKVYRLDLKKNGGTVAVKQLWKGDGLKLLTAEMDILGKIRHRNILKLYACLVKGGSNLLVFEYMENGNLFQALHRQLKGGQPELDWYQRYRIALGAARGISYLHHDCSPPIIHRDIKSTNILLDDDYEAKVADFGVAKIVQNTPKGSECSSFAGTHGYIAPELAYTAKVTEKCDVYSFGVVLLELVTGRRPIEDDYGEGKDIVYWVSANLNDRENVLKVLDDKVADENIQDDMIKVLKVAILCTTKLPSLRPTMREVIKMLIDADPGTFTSPSNNSVKEGKDSSSLLLSQ